MQSPRSRHNDTNSGKKLLWTLERFSVCMTLVDSGSVYTEASVIGLFAFFLPVPIIVS